MAQQSGQDRTEAPTPKRKQEARKKGQVARSGDLTAASVLLASFMVFVITGPDMLASFKMIVATGLRDAGSSLHQMSASQAAAVLIRAATEALGVIAPLLAVCTVTAILVGLGQTRANFTLEALQPQAGRINPITGIKRLFGLSGLVETVKAFLKVLIVGAVAFIVIQSDIPNLASLTGADPQVLLPATSSLVVKLMIACCLAFLALGAADFAWQRFDTGRQLKMTKEEVRQEAKQTEMSAEAKQHLKRRQQDMAQRRMMAAVPESDVVVTNPTHYAVALKYSPPDPAPAVVAKGQDLVALRIRAAAELAGVPVMENPPLARSLHAACEIDDMIPEELFTAVAELLAYVYKAAGQAPGAPDA